MAASSIYGYLEGQSADQLASLYRSHWCALAIYQSLDPLSKQLLLRLLFFKSTVVAFELLEQWVKPQHRCRAELRAAVDHLVKLHILGVPAAAAAAAPSGGGGDVAAAPPRRGLDMNGPVDTDRPLVINGFFVASLQHALTTEERTPWATHTAALPALLRPPDGAAIEAYAAHRWNAVLHFLIGTSDAPVPDGKVIELLVSTHLLAPGGSAEEEVLFDGEGNAMGTAAGSDAAEEGGVDAATAAARAGRSLTFDEIMELGGGAVHITRSGYEFLLKDTAVQVGGGAVARGG